MDTNLNSSMPSSEESEKAILSCFFLRPSEDLPDFMATMPPESFYHYANRLLYDTICKMHLQGKPIDSPAVLTYLMDSGNLDRIGGPGALAEVACTHLAPSLYPYYKEILLGKLFLRRMLTATQEAIQTLLSHDPASPVQETLAAVEQSILSVSEKNDTIENYRPWKKVLFDAEDRYEAAIRGEGALPGISTGFSLLDKATGGMRAGQVWTVGGGTSDGKSAFAQNIAAHLGSAQIPTCIYTLEMTEDEIVDRLFSIQSGLPSNKFQNGLCSRNDQQLYFAAKAKLQKWPIQVRDVSSMRLSALRADMRLMSRRHHIRVFIVDYLQLITPDQKGHSREREVAELSAAMKAEAKMLGATVLSLSQVNEQGALRESRAIAQDSDVVALLTVPSDVKGEPLDHLRNLQLIKMRSEKRGTILNFGFDGPTLRFKAV